MATTESESYIPNQLYQVPLALLLTDPARPRKYLEPTALDELTHKKELLKIANKKQERGMFTAYRKYRAAQAKAATPAARTVTKRTASQASLALMNETGEMLSGLDLKSLPASELTPSLEMMTRLKNFLEETLANAPQLKKKPT
ncbi:MAG: hypothetical protein PHN75_09570 [Syntrophales bacterium]|nr:hypothetical protein [Syntrophales bacterium]